MTTLLKELTQKLMVKRLIDKLELKEKKFHLIMRQLLEQIRKLGYTLPPHSIPMYKASYIDPQKICHFVTNQWSGPCSKEYESVPSDKWKERGENWIDRESHKITGPHFFALHITQSKAYLIECCDAIIGISPTEKRFVFKYCAGYLVYTLLSAMVKHHVGRRPTSKPLIPHKTLRNSDEILRSLGEFDPSLNLSDIQWSKRKKINSKEFYDKMADIARRLKDKWMKEMRCHIRNAAPDSMSNNHNMRTRYNEDVMHWVTQSVQFINSCTMSKVHTLSESELRMLTMVKQIFTDHHYLFSFNTNSNNSNGAGMSLSRPESSFVNADTSHFSVMDPSALHATTSHDVSTVDNPLSSNNNYNEGRPLKRRKKRKHCNDYEGKCELQATTENPNANTKRKLNDPFAVFDYNATSNNSHKQSISSDIRRPIEDYY